MEPENFTRHSYTIQTLGTSSLTLYYVGYQHCSPSHSWGPGCRDHYLLHYIISGKGTYMIDGATYSLSAGDAILSRPGNMIYFCADDIDPWTYRWIGFSGNECAYLLSRTAFKNTIHVIHPDYGSKLEELLRLTYEERGNALSDTLQMTSRLYQFFSCLIQFSKNQEICDTAEKASIARITEYISAHLSDEDLSVKHLADYGNMSQSTLYRAFLTQLGKSPQNYITELRMKAACTLLRTTDIPVISIAYSVGYSSSQYFSRCFKNFVGMCPSDYAKRCRIAGKDVGIEKFLPYIP